MIKVNLLGKKKKSLPFGFEKVLEKAGVTDAHLAEVKPALPKVVAIAVGLYLANFIPNYLYEQRLSELQAEQAKVSKTVGTLRTELGSLRKVRQDMERLQKEESEVAAQLSTIEGLTRGREKAFDVLNNIMEALPKKVWIDTYEYRANTINLKGSSWEFFPINDMIRNLSENTNFEAITLRSIRSEAVADIRPGIPMADQKTKDFQIEMLVHNKK